MLCCLSQLKKDYLDTIGDTVDVVIIGAYYGSGKRAGTYGSYLCAVYNPDRDEYQTLCKVNTQSVGMIKTRSESVRFDSDSVCFSVEVFSYAHLRVEYSVRRFLESNRADPSRSNCMLWHKTA